MAIFKSSYKSRIVARMQPNYKAFKNKYQALFGIIILILIMCHSIEAVIYLHKATRDFSQRHLGNMS